MADQRQQELISASLDGELTAQEQAAVDQLLANDPEAATLHEELRALSSTLQAMPQRRVGEDLSAKVLRLAEQEKLVTPSSAAPGSAVPHSGSSDLHWRKYTWAAMAVAAALVIMLVQTWNDESDMSSVALTPKDAAREPSASVMSEAPAEETELMDALALQEAPAGEIPADAPGRVANSQLRKGQVGKSESTFGAAKGASARSTQPGSRTSKKSGVPLNQTDPGATDSVATNRGAKSGLRGQGNNLRQETTGRANERKDGSGVGGGALGLAKSVDRNRVGDALKQLGETSTEINPQGVLVVQIDVSPEAAKQGTFDQLLARNNIVFVEEKLASATNTPSATAPASVPTEPAPQPAAKPRAPVRQPVAEAQKEPATDSSADGTLLAAQEDMVYVVASYQQIQQTLASLGSGRDQYLSVEVNPAPEAAAQRPLAAFSRKMLREAESQESEGEGLARPSQTTSPAVNNSVDKASANKPPKRSEKKTDSPQPKAPLDPKIQQKSKAVAQDAETAKFAQSHRSGYAQRIQPPKANARRARTATTGQQAASGKQKSAEPADDRRVTQAQPIPEAVQSAALAETKADAKPGFSATQTMRVLFVLRVVNQPELKAGAAGQAPAANPAPQADPAK